MSAGSASGAASRSLSMVSSLWWSSSCSRRMVAVVRRSESRMARAVARLSEQRCPEDGSQEIVVSESICRVVNNLTIRSLLDAGRDEAGRFFSWRRIEISRQAEKWAAAARRASRRDDCFREAMQRPADPFGGELWRL